MQASLFARFHPQRITGPGPRAAGRARQDEDLSGVIGVSGVGPLSRVVRWVVLGNLLVAALLILGTWWSLQGRRDDGLAQARETADNLAHSLSIELAAQFNLVENALATVAMRHAAAGDAAERGRVLAQALGEQGGLLPFVDGLRATDANGLVTLGLPSGTPAFSVRQRAYFEQARQSRGPVTSEPVYSQALRDWCVIVAQPLRSADGDFSGIVYAVLAARHVQALFGARAIGRDGELALRHESLRLLARHAATGPAGEDELPVGWQRQGASQGWFVARGADGVERMTAYRRVPGRDFIVFAGLGTQAYLAHGEADMRRQWLLTGAVLLMVVGGFAYLAGQHRRQYAARTLAARTAKEQALVLNNDLVGMVRVQGRRVLWANRALHRILGHDDGALVGQSMRALYADEASFEHVGALGYAALGSNGRFQTQLKMRARDGREIWVDLSAAALGDAEFLWMVVDIDQLKRSEERAQHQALHDGLTGLANRHLFEELLRQASAQARRDGQGLTVCYMDLDGFKPVNDTHGHQAGDAVLRAVGERLRRELRGNDSVARLGGDEFAWCLAGVADEAEAAAIVARCVDAISQPVELASGATVKVGASVGLASSRTHGHSAQKLLLAADEAMYLRKRSARR